MFINVNLFGLYIHNTIPLQQQNEFIVIMENKNDIWRPVSEYTGGRVLATNGLDVLIGKINSEGDCESEEDGNALLCGITGFIKIEEMLTELKESEDERIRKEIIAFITTTPKARISHKEWISWLEKKGEQKSVEDIAKEVIKDKESAVKFMKSAGIMDSNGELAKEYRDEQNLVESTDDLAPILQGYIPTIMNKHGMPEIEADAITETAYYFYSLGAKKSSEDKRHKELEWSEEDENHFKSILSTIECCKVQYPNAPSVVEAYNADAKWLKSLKPQPKQEWSEEDLRHINTIIMFIEDDKIGQSKMGLEVLNKEIDWLIALKDMAAPQKHWKPSDVQMKALLSKLPVVKGGGDKVQDILESLYQDLLTLKGE